MLTMIALVTSLAGGRAPANADVAGTVTDSSTGAPLPSVEVTVQRGNTVVANTSTDPFGRYIIHNVAAGAYTVAAHFIGFRAQQRAVTFASGTVRVDFRLVPAPTTIEGV